MESLIFFEKYIETKVIAIKKGRIPFKERNAEHHYYDISNVGGMKIEKKSYYRFFVTLVTEEPIKKLEQSNVTYLNVPMQCVDLFYKRRERNVDRTL